MYVLSDPRRAGRRAVLPTMLDDLADVAVRALAADAAVIVVDSGMSPWKIKRTGTATAPLVPAGAAAGSPDLATLVDPVAADAAGYAFYAATPVRDMSGTRIGTLAILAHEMRAVSDDDLVMLRKIAGIAGHAV